MKIAITAVSGQLGAAIAKRAIKEFGEKNVVGTARTPEKVNLGIKVFKADYNNKEDFISAFQDMNVVLLVSGMDAPDKRVEQHRNVINAARISGVRKIVYTSIIGKPGNSMFDPIVNTNRQTEKDIINSGLKYAIGRNGLYIEPDIAYIDNYIKEGNIANCAADGKCSYTTRDEIAIANTELIKKDSLNGSIYNLVGEAITQTELVGYFNKYFKTSLIFESLSIEDYLKWQKEHNGEFLGPIIAGIYQKIRNEEFDMISDFEKVTGRKHKSISEIFKEHSNL